MMYIDFFPVRTGAGGIVQPRADLGREGFRRHIVAGDKGLKDTKSRSVVAAEYPEFRLPHGRIPGERRVRVECAETHKALDSFPVPVKAEKEFRAVPQDVVTHR
jgi:hypothetical protein